MKKWFIKCIKTNQTFFIKLFSIYDNVKDNVKKQDDIDISSEDSNEENSNEKNFNKEN